MNSWSDLASTATSTTYANEASDVDEPSRLVTCLSSRPVMGKIVVPPDTALGVKRETLVLFFVVVFSFFFQTKTDIKLGISTNPPFIH